MRNRLLQITRSVIAYLPELKPYTGSVVGCLLMQQMDFWFNLKPDGFYKFLSPSEHPDYRDGDSWTEELAISEAEFRTAIDRICHRWPSKSAFDAADDKFQGKFYCSVYDRRRQLTTYFRNHPLVDACLDELAARSTVRNGPGRAEGGLRESGQFPRQNGPQAPVFPVNAEAQATADQGVSFPVSQGSSFTGNDDSVPTVDTQLEFPVGEPGAATGGATSASQQMPDSQLQETGKGTLPIKAKKPLSKDSKDSKQPQPGSCGPGLIFPTTLTPSEITAITSMLVGCPEEQRQDVLDEIAGYKNAGAIHSSSIALTRQLIEAVKSGTFVGNRGIAVRDARTAAQQHVARIAQASTTNFDPADISEETLNRLPPAVRAKTLEALNRSGRQ